MSKKYSYREKVKDSKLYGEGKGNYDEEWLKQHEYMKKAENQDAVTKMRQRWANGNFGDIPSNANTYTNEQFLKLGLDGKIGSCS